MIGTSPDIFDEVFGDSLRPARQPPSEPTPTIVAAEEASGKLCQNLDLALDRQREILSSPVTPEMPPRDKRLIADVAHQVARTAVSVDEQRLKRKPDDEKLAAIMARLWEVRKELEREGHIIPSLE
jgi:hypothetical protein